MKITLKEMGIFKQAEYELGELTIICGRNNTGKTYATYSLYGYLDYLKNGFRFEIDEKIIDELFSTGTYSFDLSNYSDKIIKEIERSCSEYKTFLPLIFAANQKRFENSEFQISVSKEELKKKSEYNRSFKFSENDILQITKVKEKEILSISLASKSNQIKNESTKEIIKNEISEAFKYLFFTNTFPNIFIASAERTGISMFIEDLKKNLHNRLIEKITSTTKMSFPVLFNEFYNSPYPLPIDSEIKYISDLAEIIKFDSFIVKDHPEIINEFINLLGGDYKHDKEGLWFVPNKTRSVKLNMGESSSSVRSLLDVGFYLKHLAKKGDMLMIDEPEINLHPENQIKLAKLFARLVNIGVKVFITTHSDYIIKELNTLIMLNYKKENDAIRNIMKKKNYNESELIDPNKIRVYIACEEKIKVEGYKHKVNRPTLKKAEIDEFYGIEAESFDETIDEMNRIQKSIIFEG